jgi:hypothetical protein
VAIKALDLITIVIPPALPAAMTVGKMYAQNRLQACKIYCINSRVINVAGSINCVCFDKVRERGCRLLTLVSCPANPRVSHYAADANTEIRVHTSLTSSAEYTTRAYGSE